VRLHAAFDSLFRLLGDCLAPHLCGCGKRVGEGAFCEACGKQLGEPLTLTLRLPHPEKLRALAHYPPPISNTIRRMKFQGGVELTAPLADSFLHAHTKLRQLPPPDWLVPVPVHARRLVERGFNQSALLAGDLARRLNCRSAPRLLRKEVETASQASLGLQERRRNLRSAYRVRSGARNCTGRVVLVDDVVTTGETARACIHTLHTSGIEVGEVWALAHTPA
jgi:ComF family protein